MIRIFDKVIDQIVAVIQNLFMSSLDEKTPEVSIHFLFSYYILETKLMCSPVHHPDGRTLSQSSRPENGQASVGAIACS